MRVGGILRGLVIAAVMAGPALADPVQDEVTSALVDQGYDIVSVNRTWLGRVRIVAESDDLRREIVFNPTTGEVLRDYSVRLMAAFPDLGFEDDSPGGSDRSAAARVATGAAASVAGDPAASALEVLQDSVAAPVDVEGQ